MKQQRSDDEASSSGGVVSSYALHFSDGMRVKRTPTTSSRGRPHSKSPPSAVTPAPDKPPRGRITTPTSLPWLSRPLLESKGQRQCAGPLESCCPSGAETRARREGGERILSNAWLVVACWAGCSRCYFPPPHHRPTHTHRHITATGKSKPVGVPATGSRVGPRNRASQRPCVGGVAVILALFLPASCSPTEPSA